MSNVKAIENQKDLNSLNGYIQIEGKTNNSSHSTLKAQVLTEKDILLLRTLEIEKWGEEGATELMLKSRVSIAPNYCWGYFDYSKSKILGSCFVMGLDKEKILNAKNWHETTDDGMALSHDKTSKTWFGISLSGNHTEAVLAIMIEVFFKVIRDGIKEVYLGAPIPGYHKWSLKNKDKTVHDYLKIFRTSGKSTKHIDPLLTYYMHYGFQIVCAKENYFPHEKAHNYGVLIKYKNPIWFLAPLIRLVPQKILKKIVLKVSTYY